MKNIFIKSVYFKLNSGAVSKRWFHVLLRSCVTSHDDSRFNLEEKHHSMLLGRETNASRVQEDVPNSSPRSLRFRSFDC